MNLTDEGAMIRQLRKGDPKVMQEVYHRYKAEFITWMISQYSCQRLEALEIYHDSLLTISDQAKNGKFEVLRSSLKTYIYGVAKNKYREYLRKNKKNYLRPVGDIPDREDEVVDLSQQDSLALVEECLDSLGDPCKSILELYYFHEMSMQDISEQMNYKNRNTVKNMKYKCLLRLKDLFGEEWKRRMQ